MSVILADLSFVFWLQSGKRVSSTFWCTYMGCEEEDSVCLLTLQVCVSFSGFGQDRKTLSMGWF